MWYGSGVTNRRGPPILPTVSLKLKDRLNWDPVTEVHDASHRGGRDTSFLNDGASLFSVVIVKVVVVFARCYNKTLRAMT